MRGHNADRTATIIVNGHANMENISRGHCELGVEAQPRLRVAVAFDEHTQAI